MGRLCDFTTWLQRILFWSKVLYVQGLRGGGRVVSEIFDDPSLNTAELP